MFKRRGVSVLGLVVLVVLAGVLVRGCLKADRTSLDSALRMAPEKTLRAGFTDWSAVRRITGVPRTTSAEKIGDLVDRAYERDLSAVSVLVEGAVAMQEHFGFSPGTLDWELTAIARAGATTVMRLDDEVDVDDVRAALEESGFVKPEDEEGVWKGGVDLVFGLDSTLSTQLQFVVVLEDQHTVVASDAEKYAATAAKAARGDATTLAEADDTDALTGSVEDPVVAATLWSRDFACEDLALTKGAPGDLPRAQEVIDQAGGVGPLAGLLMARPASARLTVVERYEDQDRARRDLEARAKLAVGEAVGRGGSFTDDFELTGSRTDGANVVLTMEAADNGFLLSSLNHGPILFAAC